MKKILKATQTKYTNQAIKLAKQIEEQYMLLDGEDDNFFHTYHDDMKIQSDCAWDVVAEMEDNKKIEHFELDITSLEDTLEYCKAVIQLQIQTNNLPRAIFG
jgi:hypothetical protein